MSFIEISKRLQKKLWLFWRPSNSTRPKVVLSTFPHSDVTVDSNAISNTPILSYAGNR